MTEQEMLERDIATLKESVNLDWRDLQKLGLSKEEAAGIRKHIDFCIKDLKDLIERRARLKGKTSN